MSERSYRLNDIAEPNKLEHITDNFEGAMTILQDLDNTVPGLAMVKLRMIGLLRRQGNFPKVEELYEELATSSSDAEICSFYAVKYARYLAKVS